MKGEAYKGEIREICIKNVTTPEIQYFAFMASPFLTLLIAMAGLLFLVDVEAWTYHYGDKSDLTWEEARIFCQTWFTDLVAIQNQEEIAYLNAVVPRYRKYYWIGIRKINNTWTWVGTNKILTKEAENWAYREPNNKKDNQDCVEIYIQRDREAGKWNDEPCTKKKRALCYQASCHPSSCSEQGECVETIGNYTCQCYPGFFGPECEYGVQCKPLNSPPHGDFSCSHMYGDFQYQSTCNFTCAEGFVISGAETTVCEKSGEWSSLVPSCQVKQCQEIEPPRRGTMDCVNPIGDFAYNSTCNFSCEPGFELIGAKNLQCSASGQWSSHVPLCQALQCKPLQFPAHGNSTCFHIHGEFRYQSNCTFHCKEGFLLLGEEMIRCTAQGEWTSAIPVCKAIECPKLNGPKNGELKCSHLYGDFMYNSTCSFSCNRGFVRIGTEQVQCTALGMWTEKPPVCKVIQCHSLQRPEKGQMDCSHPVGKFAFQSTCAFACEPGFALTGTKATHCLATGNWSAPIPTCQVTECEKLHAPENGELNCSHPYGDFAYSSSCIFYCNRGFVRVGTEQLQCTAVGAWTEKPPLCEAVKCPALHEPDNGHFSCIHPYAKFAYGSSCNFSCSVGFQLVGLEVLDCLAGGNWTEQLPHCKAIQCPALEIPDNGKGNCSHPYGQFAYNSSCIFSCNSGFQLIGAQKLKCMDQGKWTGDVPICEASKCPVLHAPVNGQLNCSHPHGHFAYNSSCAFSCNMGFVQVGSKMLNCTDLGKWTGSVPICEVKRCPLLTDIKNMRMNCSNPLGSFSYRSSCRFHCAEGYILNGTSTIRCQPNGQWSAEMPLCKESVAPFLKQVLLYTGGAAASVVVLALSGGLIALAIKHLSRRGERKKLLSHTSDLGVPGVFSNAAFDSGF
ncbi:hypothetical protein JD844_017243 [Phrynosoma platyrhinos]|uniref:p-selectin n=1 Tax=Phrynosoma platyrhinos TaxID=52577 RepID=A0ABQ7SLP0_PHRPL|nr:hypothetical protein JD844_017243 [Phrynosoma platyrhinos]